MGLLLERCFDFEDLLVKSPVIPNIEHSHWKPSCSSNKSWDLGYIANICNQYGAQPWMYSNQQDCAFFLVCMSVFNDLLGDLLDSQSRVLFS